MRKPYIKEHTTMSLNPFKYSYKMEVVNPDKNVVTLAPTASTWAKAFGPTLILVAVGAIYTAIESRKTPTIQFDLDDEDLSPVPPQK